MAPATAPALLKPGRKRGSRCPSASREAGEAQAEAHPHLSPQHGPSPAMSQLKLVSEVTKGHVGAGQGVLTPRLSLKYSNSPDPLRFRPGSSAVHSPCTCLYGVRFSTSLSFYTGPSFGPSLAKVGLRGTLVPHFCPPEPPLWVVTTLPCPDMEGLPGRVSPILPGAEPRPQSLASLRSEICTRPSCTARLEAPRRLPGCPLKRGPVFTGLGGRREGSVLRSH